MGQFVRPILCIVLGLATAIVVACTIAIWRPTPVFTSTHVGYFVEGGRPWQVSQFRAIGMTDSWWYNLHDIVAVGDPVQIAANGLQAYRTQAPASSAATTTVFTEPLGWGETSDPRSELPVANGRDSVFGFPFPCLWYQTLPVPTGRGFDRFTLNGGWLLQGPFDARFSAPQAIPLRPIWSALALNTCFYAILWSAVIYAPALNRVRWRARGQCTRCGYQRQGLPETEPCPECGYSARS